MPVAAFGCFEDGKVARVAVELVSSQELVEDVRGVDKVFSSVFFVYIVVQRGEFFKVLQQRPFEMRYVGRSDAGKVVMNELNIFVVLAEAQFFEEDRNVFLGNLRESDVYRGV